MTSPRICLQVMYLLGNSNSHPDSMNSGISCKTTAEQQLLTINTAKLRVCRDGIKILLLTLVSQDAEMINFMFWKKVSGTLT